MDEHITETSEKEPVKKEKKTYKRASKSRVKEKTSVEKSLLLLELAEIKEISDKLFERIEKKIEVLKALEASVDEKINALKRLGQETVSETPSDEIQQRKNMILSLRQKGLEIEEISSILKIPKGEVELILNLHEGNKSSDVSNLEREEKISIIRPQKNSLPKINGSKYFFKKLIWLIPLFAIGIFVYVYYSYFIPEEENRTAINSQISEQNFTLQQTSKLEEQQALNPYEEKEKAIDLIRKKYIVSSDSTEVKEVNKKAVEKKEGIQKPDILKLNAKENEQKEGKKTITVITKSATIRSDHSINSQPITWVNQGVSFEIKEEFTDDAGKRWYKIITSDGKEGWIADKVVN